MVVSLSQVLLFSIPGMHDIADICLLTQCTNIHDDDQECSKCLNNYVN